MRKVALILLITGISIPICTSAEPPFKCNPQVLLDTYDTAVGCNSCIGNTTWTITTHYTGELILIAAGGYPYDKGPFPDTGSSVTVNGNNATFITETYCEFDYPSPAGQTSQSVWAYQAPTAGTYTIAVPGDSNWDYANQCRINEAAAFYNPCNTLTLANIFSSVTDSTNRGYSSTASITVPNSYSMIYGCSEVNTDKNPYKWTGLDILGSDGDYAWAEICYSQACKQVSAGTYTVTAACASGANGSVLCLVAITPNACYMSDSVTVTNVTCYGFSDGVATAVAFNGTPPYSYIWSNGDTTSSATGLPYNGYTVVVTDSFGCYSVTGIILSQPTALLASATELRAAGCGSCSNGAAEANNSGGTQPYTYSWSGGQTTQVANGLTVGAYTCTVCDNNGCCASSSVGINDKYVVIFNYKGYDQYNGTVQTWTVPECVNTVTAELWGAGGGAGYFDESSGGSGAYVEGIANVNPGQTLYIVVGAGGVTYPQNNNIPFGGGGSADEGGSGGGRSAIQLEQDSDIADAGGGGGGIGGTYYYAKSYGNGGAGGNGTQPNGVQGNISNGWSSGSGGCSTDFGYGGWAGGAGAGGLGECGALALYNGGTGSQYQGGSAANYTYYAGGGGGGYYGGGSGAGIYCSGGGGGGSYPASGTPYFTLITSQSGNSSPNGNFQQTALAPGGTYSPNYNEGNLLSNPVGTAKAINSSAPQGIYSGNGEVAISYQYDSTLSLCPVIGDTSVTPNSNQVYTVLPLNGVSSYVWSVGAGNTIVMGQGTTQITARFNNQGYDTVCVYALFANGCGVSGACCLPVGVSVVNGTSLSPEEGNQWTVEPNPNNGEFILQMKNEERRMKNEVFEIYNVYGQEVYSATIKQTLNTVNLATSDGVYFYRVVDENGGIEGEGKVIVAK